MIGRIVAGRFELERLAGAGGMGTVYRARDLAEGRHVAVKLLSLRDARGAERLDMEATILADLAHPAIVRYLAHGLAENGERYIAMEWLDGEDLGARLGRLDRQTLTPAESIGVIRRAAEALAHAHPRGIIHRDIKPENLFLPDASIARLKVLDFGIARLARGARRLTATGSVVGTPGYMAPEVLRAERDITPAADVFSLGCVLFQCLTGRPIFEGDDATALMAKILLQDAPRLFEIAPELPEALDDLLARMLAKDPAARLANGVELLRELDLLSDLGDVAVPASHRARRPSLTATEQRIACVVMTGSSQAAADAAAARWRDRTVQIGVNELSAMAEEVSASGAPSPLAVLEADIAKVYAGRVHVLPDGCLVVTVSDLGKPKDQAANAARCALAMRSTFPNVPVVIATGPGRFSAWSVAGEVIDAGSRLLRATTAGAIRLDDTAAGLLDGRFDIQRDGADCYLRGERDIIETKRNFLGKSTDFVGRGREISMLTNLMSSVTTESSAAAVLVTGAAGIGKSRLRQEFMEWVQRTPGRVEVLFGAGDSLAAGSPFSMLGRAMRRAAAIHDGESVEAKRRKLSERIARTVAREWQVRVAAFLGEIAGVPFPDDTSDALRAARQNPQLMSDGVRRAWEDWLAAECAAGPVLILLEDLHWGDLGTVTLIDAALRTLRERPLMVLALARPDVFTTFPGLWRERELQNIRLAPLSRKAAERLVREALGLQADTRTVDEIVARADGNPFFIEELIRAAVDGRGGGALPDSVLGTVQSRLDAEGADARRVLRAASVFGERFARAGVVALLGGEHETEKVSGWLEHLVTRELIVRVAQAERTGAVEFAFTHALVREAAYAMLTDEDRMLGHRLAGDWLEQAGFGDAMTLAEHFRRGEEPGRALRWYQKAADQALNANDLAAAIERAGLGLDAGAAGEAAGALKLTQAEAHVWRGELALAEARALEAVAELAPGTVGWLRAQGQAVIAAAKRGDLDRVETQVRQVTKTLPDFGARNAEIVCLAWAANYLIFGGRLKAADDLMLMIGDLAGDLSEVDAQAVALIRQVQAIRASATGDLGSCLDRFAAALACFDRAGDLRNACAVRSNMAYVHAELGDFQRAETALRNALGAAERMGLHDVTAQAQHNLGRVLALLGRLDEARVIEQKAVDSFRTQGDPRLEGVARTYLAEIALGAGQGDEAEREATTAVGLLKVAPSLKVAAAAVRARALLVMGNPTRALATAEEAFRDLEALGEIEEGEAMVRLTYAECLAETGALPKARAVIVAARARLMAHASRIAEEPLRARFLRDVPSHARTLALAAAWSATAGGAGEAVVAAFLPAPVAPGARPVEPRRTNRLAAPGPRTWEGPR
ncbi:MAG: protein kinase [Pseudomonadota bacterium]